MGRRITHDFSTRTEILANIGVLFSFFPSLSWSVCIVGLHGLVAPSTTALLHPNIAITYQSLVSLCFSNSVLFYPDDLHCSTASVGSAKLPKARRLDIYRCSLEHARQPDTGSLRIAASSLLFSIYLTILGAHTLFHSIEPRVRAVYVWGFSLAYNYDTTDATL